MPVLPSGSVERSSVTASLLGRLPTSGDCGNDETANIVVVGAGWWSQGWHLPHLDRNDRVTIVAIIDTNPRPASNLNSDLEPLSSLAERYRCPVFRSVGELLADPIGRTVDGAIVCTPHSTHYGIGAELIGEGARRYAAAERDGRLGISKAGGGYRPMNVFMEKPMTTNVREARDLHELVTRYRRPLGDAGNTKDDSSLEGGGLGCFLLNHSANFRPQARAARSIVRSGKIGAIQHVTGFFASPLSWIFDDPSNRGWNEPDGSGEMLGNGFAWGQCSHLLAWIYHVVGLEELVPSKVFCAMTTSDKTGADVSHAATIICESGATFGLSGTSLLPGNAHSDPPVAKRVKITIFGTKGALIYCGNDRDPSSGSLEWLREDGTVEVQCPELGFDFEDLDQGGVGPESLQCFVDACLGKEGYYVGADSAVGLRSVQTIDAMYQSHVSGNCESVRFTSGR